ncbi:hypothetical protein C3F09_07460, partial [candidate division GN15 bacterium]
MRKLLCLVGSLLGASVLASPVTFDSHHISLKLDVPTHSAVITDSGTVGVTRGWNWFYLNDSAKVQKYAIDGRKCTFRTARAKDTTQLPVKVREELRSGAELPDAMLVMFESGKGKAAKFKIEYSAVFNEDVSNIRFSRESVGREVSGTILDQGAYLSPSSYFYPQGSEQMSDYSVTADIPATWSSICDGNLLASTTAGERKTESWHNPYKNDGCILMAAPYVPSNTTSDSTEIVCLFFHADTSLAPNYLKASAGYVKMYSDLIGPYPFKRFTIAENFFPTGYGMPGWTLLGQSVIRLPFIISSSLGHEVLHNWWGNSVYVDYNRGNWCEGLTVYGADYQYKLKESPAAAREYRKDILKQYVSYV